MTKSEQHRRHRVQRSQRRPAPESTAADPAATLVPLSRPSEARPALAVEAAPLPPPALDEALTATIRRWATPTTPEELASRGVKHVRSVSMSRVAGLIEKAVNKALIARTLEGGAVEALTLSTSAREEFLRLTRADADRDARAGGAVESEAVSTLDRIRADLARRRKELAGREQEPPADANDSAEDSELEERLRALFAVHGGTQDHTLEQETLDLVLGEVRGTRRRARVAQRQEHANELSQLERRISKLSILLGNTEDDLRLARAGRVVDEGIGSIYDEVQGIDGGDVQFGQKVDLMKSIFEANLALRG